MKTKVDKIESETKGVIDKYCEEQALKLAQTIDDKIAIVINNKPWYCPGWLYKKIIKDTVNIINIKESL